MNVPGGKGLLAVNRSPRGKLRTTGFDVKRFLETLTEFDSTNVVNVIDMLQAHLPGPQLYPD